MQRYAVIGLGRFGSTLARRLGESGAEVIAIDKDEERVSAIRDHVSIAVRLNATDERSLREQGVDKVDVAVVGMGESFEATQLTTVVLKGLGVKRVIVKSVDPLHEEIMRRIGADEVVSPEKEAAYRLAQVLLAPRLLDYIQLSEGHCLVQINAPEKFYGKTIRELDVRNVFSVNIVAIKKRKETGRDEAGKPVYEEKLVDIPRPTDVIDVSDVLVVIGEDADISRLAR
jgi:trk/ktr system potassium uptake protein